MQSFVVSIHDVMPKTLARCDEIVALLRENDFVSPTLLVVPGLDWKAPDIDRLRMLTRKGAILAGHGWNHRAARIHTPYHRIHSALISRDVAEHLALDASGICALIRRCHRFFVEHDLPVSDLYVPPAWALGTVSGRELEHLPFRFFESLLGVYDARRRSFIRSPMVGYEADTAFRALSCRLWNRLNLRPGRSTKPVRLAIHPNDLDLRLADDLKSLIQAGRSDLNYSVFAD